MCVTDLRQDFSDDGFDGLGGDIDFDALHEKNFGIFRFELVDVRNQLFERLHTFIPEPLEFSL